MPTTAVNSPGFTSTVPDPAATCSFVLAAAPCAASEVFRALCSTGIFLTAFMSTPGCFISHVITEVCSKLHTSKQAGEGLAPQSILTAVLKLEKIEKD